MTEKQVPSGVNIISGTLRVFLYFHTMYLQVRNINLEKNSRLSQWALCFHTMQCTFKSEIYRVHLLGVSKEGSSYFNIWCLSFLISLSTLRLRGELWRSLLLSFDRLSQFFQRLLLLSATPTNFGNYNLKIEGVHVNTSHLKATWMSGWP